MIISAKLIRKPRAAHVCPACNQVITGPKIRLYGAAHLPDEKPYVIFQHPSCLRYSTDPKIKAILECVK